jgi:hypothetical protein
MDVRYASEDIPVWKIVLYENNIIKAYYHNQFIYVLNTIFKCDLVSYKYESNCYVTEGFHSYSNEVGFQKLEFIFVIISGLKHFDVLDSGIISEDYKIMECIIPKGSKYAVNDKGEYVSDCIKPIAIKKLPNTTCSKDTRKILSNLLKV